MIAKMVLIGDCYHEILTRNSETVTSADCCSGNTTDSYANFDLCEYFEYATNEIIDFISIYPCTNDHAAQWVLREKPYVSKMFLSWVILTIVKRRMMSCNRKGIGLRIRQ